jgi:hypothetical protein
MPCLSLISKEFHIAVVQLRRAAVHPVRAKLHVKVSKPSSPHLLAPSLCRFANPTE